MSLLEIERSKNTMNSREIKINKDAYRAEKCDYCLYIMSTRDVVAMYQCVLFFIRLALVASFIH